MEGPPNNHVDWRNCIVGGPYQSEDLPIPDLSEEKEDPSKEEVTNNEEYEPLEIPDFYEEYMIPDTQMDKDLKESSTVRAPSVVTPSPPSPPQMPRCPLAIGDQQTSPFYEPAWFTEALRQMKNTDIPAHYEPGESSQAPQPDHLAPQNDGLADRVHHLEELPRDENATFRAFEQRLERLDEENRSNKETIQLLCYQINVSRAEATTMSAQIRALEYRAQIAENQWDATKHHVRMVEQRADVAEQERRQLQERYDYLVRLT